MWRILTSVYVCAALTAARDIELRCSDPGQCVLDRSYRHEGRFTVEGNKFEISFEDGEYLLLDCNGHEALDSTALPSFSSALHVPHVKLWYCPRPTSGSYAHVLSNLNVTLLRSATEGNLTIRELPPHPPLQEHHFTGLEDLIQLDIIYASTSNQSAPLPGFLSALRSLRVLKVEGVTLPWVDFDLLPNTLRSLTLQLITIERLFDGLLMLHDLHELVLTMDNKNTSLTSPSPLYLKPENTKFRLTSSLGLKNFTLIMWPESRPEVLAQCNELRKLELKSPAVEVLPDGWVGQCSRLERLDIIKAMHLVTLTSKLLKNATGLRHLSLTQGVLEMLPEELFEYVPNIITLDLSGNRIQMLPSGLFAKQGALQMLVLSSNLLVPEAVDVLQELYSVEKIDLSFNPHLTDLCDQSSGQSQLLRLQKLKYLLLMETNITRICRDWRENLTLLKKLDLRWTSISELGFSDLHYTRDDSIKYEAVVELFGSPVVSVQYSEEEYNASLVAPRSRATVWLDGDKLECDCRMYWARRALYPTPELEYWDATSDSARVQGLRCASGRRLSAVVPDELECQEQAAWLPARCSLTARPAPLQRRLLRVHCDSAALTRLPLLPPTHDIVYDLLLPNNNISRIEVQDLPPHIRVLDLRNNSVEWMEEATALHILRTERVLLGGNPLACDCRLAPLLVALHSAGQNATDLRTATCADGSLLHDAPTQQCADNVHILKNNLTSVA